MKQIKRGEMKTHIVYNPCPACGGTGNIPVCSSSFTTDVKEGEILYREICPSCNGTGKGEVKEIRDIDAGDIDCIYPLLVSPEQSIEAKIETKIVKIKGYLINLEKVSYITFSKEEISFVFKEEDYITFRQEEKEHMYDWQLSKEEFNKLSDWAHGKLVCERII